MKRLLQPFVLTVTLILLVGYAYLAFGLTRNVAQALALAVPFILVWIVPVVYWGSDLDHHRVLDQIVHQASYLCMAWLSFLLVLTLARDVLLLLTVWTTGLSSAHEFIKDAGVPLILVASLVAMGVGALVALRGPHVKHVDIRVEGLHGDLDGLRIAQISDLHVGLTIGRRYVERVAALADAAEPDLVALTGDMVDGSVERLAGAIAPLKWLASRRRGFFVLGNHDCYSGAESWLSHFQRIGYTNLLNSHVIVEHGSARVIVGGVLDPAIGQYHPGWGPRPDLAIANAPQDAFRLLLAHNPKIAPAAQRAGFHLQLSGHTHAGQFFPWTLAVRLVHAPHVAGLSREGGMWVYVSAGTGTWGPPVRFGTSPELTLLRLIRV
ncbi:MAG: metallophosphoesterase [Burkholderiales bacterium]